mmetsp:Transcript_44732/g.139147  ORF Transcript_44732/g.139147 Transcript_44732/m.139147 type:complete len:235 (+) Transcript_44732:524-1228(+)
MGPRSRLPGSVRRPSTRPHTHRGRRYRSTGRSAPSTGRGPAAARSSPGQDAASRQGQSPCPREPIRLQRRPARGSGPASSASRRRSSAPASRAAKRRPPTAGAPPCQERPRPAGRCTCSTGTSRRTPWPGPGTWGPHSKRPSNAVPRAPRARTRPGRRSAATCRRPQTNRKPHRPWRPPNVGRRSPRLRRPDWHALRAAPPKPAAGPRRGRPRGAKAACIQLRGHRQLHGCRAS